jgi:hypothetical protein
MSAAVSALLFFRNVMPWSRICSCGERVGTSVVLLPVVPAVLSGEVAEVPDVVSFVVVSGYAG